MYFLVHATDVIEALVRFGLVVTTRPRGGEKVTPPIRTQIDTLTSVHSVAFVVKGKARKVSSRFTMESPPIF